MIYLSSTCVLSLVFKDVELVRWSMSPRPLEVGTQILVAPSFARPSLTSRPRTQDPPADAHNAVAIAPGRDWLAAKSRGSSLAEPRWRGEPPTAACSPITRLKRVCVCDGLICKTLRIESYKKWRINAVIQKKYYTVMRNRNHIIYCKCSDIRLPRCLFFKNKSLFIRNIIYFLSLRHLRYEFHNVKFFIQYFVMRVGLE